MIAFHNNLGISNARALPLIWWCIDSTPFRKREFDAHRQEGRGDPADGRRAIPPPPYPHPREDYVSCPQPQEEPGGGEGGPGGARRSQGGPEGGQRETRRGEEEPGGARMSQGVA